MSFEGNERSLCANGHLDERDVYSDEIAACRHCGARFVWRETVDETNGEGIETELVEIEPAAICQCVCGHEHATSAPRYAIPGAP